MNFCFEVIWKPEALSRGRQGVVPAEAEGFWLDVPQNKQEKNINSKTGGLQLAWVRGLQCLPGQGPSKRRSDEGVRGVILRVQLGGLRLVLGFYLKTLIYTIEN